MGVKRQPTAEQLLAPILDAVADRLKESIADIARQVARDVYLAELPVPLTVRAPDGARTVYLAHKQTPQLVAALTAGLDVYLHGAPGGGKSTAAWQVAQLLGLPAEYIALSPQTPEWRLMGFVDAHGRYVSTAFRRMFESGGVLIIDELDNASSALLATLNGAIAQRRATFPDIGSLAAHEAFRLVATGNTAGAGPHPAFPERRVIDAAVLDRFVVIEWEYDEQLERALVLHNVAEEHHGRALDWLTWCHKLREWAREHDPRLLVTPRAILHGARLLSAGWSWDAVADATLWRGDRERAAAATAACPVP